MPVTRWSEYLRSAIGDTPQNAIAELAGVGPSQVSRWLAGSTVPTVKTVRQLAAALGLPEYEAMSAAGHAIAVAPVHESGPATPFISSEFGAELPQSQRFYYVAAKTRHLSDILLKARHGLLDPDWRERLPSGLGCSPTSPSINAEALAIAELLNRPVEPWEPYQAPWREALDSWYMTARAAAGEAHVNVAQHHLDQVVTGERLVRAYGLNRRLGDALVPNIAPFDGLCDQSRDTNDKVYVAQRTSLTALYLAGLAAGGDDIDWRAWYLNEVNQWPETHPGRARCLLEANSALDRPLPGYWLSNGSSPD
ncbi:helix-turn-helix domain-containing protein [Mycobacteroides abscessus]|uniref:helix-turn-helix domain-containing protein n=1 Tax=Mycobacteroides abscessus TaxID=36809 RepID=UPI002107C311|nr:helix-turn-helix transcriptional regulator [Mycobacteroides abscessus]